MTDQEVSKYIASLSNVSQSEPPGPKLKAYSLSDQLFAILDSSSQPLKLSLRCDPQLAAILRQRYQEVLPGEKLDQRHWNTILLTGQLSQADLKDLINHSYNLVKKGP